MPQLRITVASLLDVCKSAPGSANGGNPRMMSNRMQTKSMIATPGKRIRLRDFDPAFKGEYESQAHAQSKLQKNVQRLAKYQDLLGSSHTYALRSEEHTSELQSRQ